jgi:hypothetical protein
MATIDTRAYASQNGDIPFLPAHAFAITKSDTTDYVPGIAVFVGGAGVVAVIPSKGDGTTVVEFTVPAGGMVPVRCKKVMSANTTATLMVGVV